MLVAFQLDSGIHLKSKYVILQQAAGTRNKSSIWLISQFYIKLSEAGRYLSFWL